MRLYFTDYTGGLVSGEQHMQLHINEIKKFLIDSTLKSSEPPHFASEFYH